MTRNYELKLKTDFAAFEGELRRYTKNYPRRERGIPGLQQIELEEWTFADGSPLDSSWSRSEPSEGRSFVVKLVTIGEGRTPREATSSDVTFQISRSSREHVLLTIGPFTVDAQPFVHAFVERSKQLWDGVALRTPMQPTEHIDPPPPVQTPPVTSVSGPIPRGPTADTGRKIRELAAYREQELSTRGKAPGWVAACDQKGIKPAQVQKHAPNLWKGWNNPSYHWKPEDYRGNPEHLAE